MIKGRYREGEEVGGRLRQRLCLLWRPEGRAGGQGWGAAALAVMLLLLYLAMETANDVRIAFI